MTGVQTCALPILKHFDFTDINRRVARLVELVALTPDSEEVHKIQRRYLAIRVQGLVSGGVY